MADLDRDALDRYITGNYGEDQYADADCPEVPDCTVCGEPADYCLGNHIKPASNAPDGALDVWLRIPEGTDESEAEANVYPHEGGGYRVDWYLTAVGLVTSVWFVVYDEAREWLEREGFEDYSDYEG